MIVTTSPKPSELIIQQSVRLASQLTARWQAREKRSIDTLLQLSEDGVIVVTEKEVRYYSAEQPTPFFFHPSMALIRIKRMLNGEHDTLIEYARCKQGDIVVDCTAGLCSDALVFAYATGLTGKVIAIESEPIIYTLAKEGLQSYKTGVAEADQAMRRIDLLQANYVSLLQQMADNSVDIVYFDPMFAIPIEQSDAIGALRSLANNQPLTKQAVVEATRVARKTVVMKEHVSSNQFATLGFQKRLINRTKVAYGVIDVE